MCFSVSKGYGYKGSFLSVGEKVYTEPKKTITTVNVIYNLILFYFDVDRCLLWFSKYLVLMVKLTSEVKTQKYASRSTE